MGQHRTQTGLAYFVESNPNLPVTVMAELLDDKEKPPRLVPAWSSSMATCLLPALRDRCWMWCWMWSHGAPWEHRARWKAPWSGRRRLLRVEARARVSHKQTLHPPPTTVPTEPGGIPGVSLPHHTPPRPSEPGNGMEERLEPHMDVPGAITSPRDSSVSWHQPHLVTGHTPSFPCCGDTCSGQSSTAPLSSGTQSPCPS